MFRRMSWVGGTRLVAALWVVCYLLTPAPVACAAGTYGLQFDGVDDYVDIGPWPTISSEIMSNAVTFECWLKSSNAATKMTLIGGVNTVDKMFFRITLNWDGRRVQQPGGIKLLQRNADMTFFAGGTASNLNTGITNGQWHHMALVFDPSTGSLAIYVDGVSQNLSFLNVATPTNMTDFEHPVLPLGAVNTRTVMDNYFQGVLAEVRIWNYARTESEIQEDMGVSLSGQPAGLVGYWQFNEGQGPTAYDGSGHGRHGTLVGPTWTTDAPPVVQLFAFSPVPADGAVDVPWDVVLSWTAGEGAQRHNVYFGDDFAAVSAADVSNPLGVLVAQDRTGTVYAPSNVLEFGRTYYWRIDEVGEVGAGNIWSFTVEPTSYTLAEECITATASSWNTDDEGPENTIDRSGLDPNDAHSTATKDMWLSADVPAGESAWIEYEFDKVYLLDQMMVWNHNSETESLVGFGVKEAIIEYSLDGTVWTAVDDPEEFGRATGEAGYESDTTIDLGKAAAKYVRITAVNNWGGVLQQYGLSEVRFFYIPMFARKPDPAAGSSDVSVEANLVWRSGRGAVSHDVFFGTDAEAVADGSALICTAPETACDPGPLTFGTTYYWKVNEVNDAAVHSIWEGDVWSFTTEEFFIVDDFEAYTDEEPNRIFGTWQDGWEIDDNGSVVGHPDPAVMPGGHFAETKIVHSGKQSMPLYYDNTGVARYSETSRTFASPQDWTAHEADTLLLYFRGRPLAFLERADGSITMSGFGANIWGTADGFLFAYKRLNGNGSIVALVDSIVDTHESAKACVMIRKTLDAGSSYAEVSLTPRKGVLFTLRLRSDVAAVWGDPQSGGVSTPLGAEIKAPYWIKLERNGDEFGAYYSADGVTWAPTYGTPQTIPMEGELFIGLGVTSRLLDMPTFVEFSNVTTTGAVTGQWQVQAVGAEQPSNDPAPLYVTLEDSMGRAATVPHPDELAITNIDWEPWPVPLGDFIAAGVDVSDITTMAIGVGDPENPPTGDTGLIYIDDIQWGRPAPDQGQ
ncbi:MAG TPA: LamG-like jellyroll fold domain-containing protein [Sedimentisphaerales bacterium]|nr:LamG-like jellyroll fold domain-containing protein [Sedimentisphaerales bacterium]